MTQKWVLFIRGSRSCFAQHASRPMDNDSFVYVDETSTSFVPLLEEETSPIVQQTGETPVVVTCWERVLIGARRLARFRRLCTSLGHYLRQVKGAGRAQ